MPRKKMVYVGVLVVYVCRADLTSRTLAGFVLFRRTMFLSRGPANEDARVLLAIVWMVA